MEESLEEHDDQEEDHEIPPGNNITETQANDALSEERPDQTAAKQSSEQAFNQAAIQPSIGRPVLRNGRFSAACLGRPFTNFCA